MCTSYWEIITCLLYTSIRLEGLSYARPVGTRQPDAETPARLPVDVYKRQREIEIELNPGHALYQGHFPGQPVVPGVCTLQMIKESAEQIVSQPLQYVQIASSKFLSAINPVSYTHLDVYKRQQ